MRSLENNCSRPLVVDLDGTLIFSDLLVENLNQYWIQHPLFFLMPFIWLFKGKPRLKYELSSRADIDIRSLPYNSELIAWLRKEKAAGRYLILATASHVLLANQVEGHLCLFDEIIATEGEVNVRAAVKAQALVSRFGERGFDYMGNDWADLPVWGQAQVAHVVNAPVALVRRVQIIGNLGHVLSGVVSSRATAFARALRLHQWMKNILVFVPLFAAHQYGDALSDVSALLAFFIFGLMASSVYFLNDLVDVQDDRHHPRKRDRPFASGALSLMVGWVSWPLLFGLAIGLSIIFLPIHFSISLSVYFVLTTAYSFYLKKFAVIDVLLLAGLYTLRIISGTYAVGLTLSFWLLLFSIFIFLSLALVKRYSELKIARDAGRLGGLRGRGYEAGDLELVSGLGSSAGLMSVLVLALYIQDKQAVSLYAIPELIWLVCPVMLYWISRTWLIAHRGQMHDDPIIFALRDRVSWAVAFFIIVIFAFARFL